MINPCAADIGRRVIYRPVCDQPTVEAGVITSYNERWVFVRYDNQHPDADGQATFRDDLEWEIANG